MAATELFSTTLFNDANLVAYYRLENVNDSKGAFTLTNSNSCTFVAAEFNNGVSTGTANTNKRLSTASNLGISGSVSISIVGWVAVNDSVGAAGDWTFFEHRDAASGVNYRVGYQGNSGSPRVYGDRAVNGVTDEITNVTQTLANGVFHHFGLVYNKAASQVIFYIDGVGQAPVTSANGSGSGTADGFAIAATANGFLFGDIIADDVAVFSRALAASDISLLVNGPASSAHNLPLLGVGI